MRNDASRVISEWHHNLDHDLPASIMLLELSMEEPILDTSAGKQLSQAATDVLLSLVLKKWTTFKYGLELWPPDVSKYE